jgi:hypothetical protein
MSLKRNNIESVINEYKKNPDLSRRYLSFDYAYNYFYKFNETKFKDDLEKSCLQLGFYLASWGMYRGSTFLLKSNMKHFQEIINYISYLPSDTWDIDVNNYNSKKDNNNDL